MTGLAVLALTFVVYSLFAARLDRWCVTAPMVFVTVGMILGPAATGSLDLSASAHVVRAVAEITLALLLFADASTVPLRDVEGDAGLPARLLLLGLPLTMVAGTVAAAAILPAIGWAAAALVASILAPTDAALGLGVFTDRSVPVRVRRALNVESGLNDGLVAPFVTVFLALVVAEETSGAKAWASEAVTDIALAVAAALVVGWLGGTLVRIARQRSLTSHTSEELAALSLALLAYTASIAIGGNGFVAAFAAGLLFRRSAGRRLADTVGFTERVGLFSSFLVWAIFGAVLAGPVLRGGDWRAFAYAIVSLTFVRMVPVAVALVRTGLSPQAVAFMGWFGPRGLASVVFTLITLEALQGDPIADPIVQVMTWTVLLSVFAHGISARPLAAAYGRSIGAAAAADRELGEASEPTVRRAL